MRVALILLVSCLVFVCAETDLPPNIGSVSELANVLANEPASAARFAETTNSATEVLSFKEEEPAPSAAPSSGSTSSGSGEGDDDSEFDTQISQIEEQIKRLKEQIKESEECSRRLSEQKAEIDSLREQKEHLNKEKEKAVLQRRLDKQMKDLAEINRMSRSLRQKFNELKHTQKLIKTKLSSTRTSLTNLDSDAEPVTMSDMSNAPDNIGSEMDAMNEAQEAILKRAHEKSGKEVRDAIKQTNRATLAEKSGSKH